VFSTHYVKPSGSGNATHGTGNKLDRAGQNSVAVICAAITVIAAVAVGYYQVNRQKRRSAEMQAAPIHLPTILAYHS